MDRSFGLFRALHPLRLPLLHLLRLGLLLCYDVVQLLRGRLLKGEELLFLIQRGQGEIADALFKGDVIGAGQDVSFRVGREETFQDVTQ